MLYVAILGIPMSIQLCKYAASLHEDCKVSLLSPRLYRRVKKKHLSAYAKAFSCGLLCLGTGLFISSVCAIFFDSLFIWLAFLLGLLLGFSMIDDTQRKYNAGWY